MHTDSPDNFPAYRPPCRFIFLMNIEAVQLRPGTYGAINTIQRHLLSFRSGLCCYLAISIHPQSFYEAWDSGAIAAIGVICVVYNCIQFAKIIHGFMNSQYVYGLTIYRHWEKNFLPITQKNGESQMSGKTSFPNECVKKRFSLL